MGTDIHPLVQRRVSGRWERVQEPETDRPRWESGLHARNYRVFAVLAGVRNGEGFAGIFTHRPITPIAEPRGLPEDLDAFDLIEHTAEECPDKDDPDFECNHRFYFGDHDFSWVTLAEILAYPWHEPLVEGGWVEQSVYEEWLARGRVGQPKGWSGSVSGSRVVHIPEYDYLAGGYSDRERHAFYIRCVWCIPQHEAVGRFYTETIPWLKTLREPEDVRLVFGFDS